MKWLASFFEFLRWMHAVSFFLLPQKKALASDVMMMMMEKEMSCSKKDKTLSLTIRETQKHE